LLWLTEIRYERVISLGKAYRSNGSNLTGIKQFT
jgi:hypothetical protein